MKGFGGLPGGLGNLQGLMKQAQKMKEDVEKLQSEAPRFTGEGSAGGGMVKVVANAAPEIVTVTLNPEALQPDDAELLQDSIKAAANEALRKANEAMKSEMRKLTSGLGIPGL